MNALHLTDREIDLVVDGGLRGMDTATEAHVRGCAHCQNRLREARVADLLVVAAGSAEELAAQPRRWSWRTGTVLALAASLAGVVVLRRDGGEGTLAVPPPQGTVALATPVPEVRLRSMDALVPAPADSAAADVPWPGGPTPAAPPVRAAPRGIPAPPRTRPAVEPPLALVADGGASVRPDSAPPPAADVTGELRRDGARAPAGALRAPREATGERLALASDRAAPSVRLFVCADSASRAAGARLADSLRAAGLTVTRAPARDSVARRRGDRMVCARRGANSADGNR